MPTNTHCMPGNLLLEHQCEDTKAVGSGGGLFWVEGTKPGAFGRGPQGFFSATCICDHHVHDRGSADTGHH